MKRKGRSISLACFGTILASAVYPPMRAHIWGLLAGGLIGELFGGLLVESLLVGGLLVRGRLTGSAIVGCGWRAALQAAHRRAVAVVAERLVGIGASWS